MSLWCWFRQHFSHMITIIELCMSYQLFYKVSFIFIETDLYFWSFSYSKQPSLRPLLHKKNYTTVYFPWILRSSRGKFSKIVSECFLQVFKGFKYYAFKNIVFLMNLVIFAHGWSNIHELSRQLNGARSLTHSLTHSLDPD